MEKLATKKISKNQTKTNSRHSDKNRKKSTKNGKNKAKQFFLLNKKLIIFSAFETIIGVVLILLAFVCNKYFLFLNRPKLFENSSLICILALTCLIINSVLPALEKFVDFWSGSNSRLKNKAKKQINLSFVNVFIVLFFCISFLAKLVWLCTFVLFLLFATSFAMLFKQKNKCCFHFSIINFLASIMLLLSIYYIYMLN